ncbi:selenocysteine lyase/cysteine desulfurase [Actinoplanes lutulentus]|uniref:Selenocysteine lyase/cysteine desulfurase n=1 Tax=Actinoplanes lutulentus TaxID=1287878 RepID=A0A327ZHP3_9ACTN|nr:aminotransferase class V-fold PLP-dependent enzyme [Actinoplanes lutulentus]MBB2946759.1 selenocysteine lyase/cysteine desulfurase [Actinoplanes lutulentus]RAK35651.1 selenocysteine lyase/cysteine desulfurase [Actinoplanes lutulentus]
MSLDIVGDDLKVTLPDGETRPFAHLDYAASAPCVEAAAQAVADLLPRYGSVHRGTGVRSQASTLAYELARDVVSEFVGAGPDDEVIFTRNTTDALNLLARALPAGTTTIVFDGEHHANLLPWPNQVRLPAPSSVAEAIAAVEQALESTTGTVLLTVTGASNVTGEVWPIKELAGLAHRHGARIAVDAAQLAPHRPINDLGADYVAFSGHKLYAPFGAGVLAGRRDWLDAADPYLCGGGASAAVGDRPGELEWATGPARHEGGTPNLLGAVAIAAVCEALTRADRDVLHEREQELLARLRAGIATIPGVTEVSLFGPDHPRVGIVSLAFTTDDPADVALRLGRDHGIGVRAGQFCAHPLVRRLTGSGVTGECGVTPGLLRISFGLGSTTEHVDRVLDGLRNS